MFLGTSEEITHINLGNIILETSDSVKLLGIQIDNKLRFKSHVNDKCKKQPAKLSLFYAFDPTSETRLQRPYVMRIFDLVSTIVH